jgi:hypothetical protein
MIPAFSAARGADQVFQTSSKAVPSMRALRYPGVFSGMREILHWLNTRSLSDIDHSTAANDPQPSASFSALKNPQRIPVNTPPVFPGLRPCIWPHLLRLVTKAMSDRLLGDRTIGILGAAREGDRLKPAGLPSRNIPPIIGPLSGLFGLFGFSGQIARQTRSTR